MQEKYQLTHPEGKKLSAIDADKYKVIKYAIIESLKDGVAITHTELYQRVKSWFVESNTPFEGSVSWYTESVKLDLEAMGIIKRIKEKQRLLFTLNNA